jgi:enoyl-CoA hydratase
MEFLKFEKKGPVGLLRINREEVLNALNQGLLEEMKAFLTTTVFEEEIRVLILTGEGPKAFIAGADIKQMKDMGHMEMLKFCDLGQGVSSLLETIDVVTIAAVNGFALGGGLEIALACDFIIASDNAKLGLPEVTLGLIPGFGGTQRLTRAVGTRMAKEMVMSADMISADEAKSIGLVNHVHPQDELIDRCFEMAEKILNNAFSAVTQAKRAINHGQSLSLQDALEMEKQCCAVSFASDNRLEGMTAFLEKRPAKFT